MTATVLAASYARVSSAHQVDGTSLDTQREALAAEISRRGWQLVDHFVDAGVSGAKSSRPELDRLMTDVRAGHIDAVCTVTVNRFGRSLSQVVTNVGELRDLGVEFVSLKENMDLSTPAGRLQLHVLASVAEFERAQIAERCVTGQRAKAAGGGFVGG